MSRQHVAVAVAGLCVTLVAGTLAEVNQVFCRADPPEQKRLNAKPRDTSSIGLECSMRLKVSQSRPTQYFDTLRSRTDLRRLSLTSDRSTEFPVSLLRVMHQLPRLEVVMFETQTVFSEEAVETISKFPSLRELVLHQSFVIAPGSFPVAVLS